VPVPVPLPDFWEPTEPSRSTTRESGPANPGRLASEPLHPCLLPRGVRVPVPVPLPDFWEDLAGLKTLPSSRRGPSCASSHRTAIPTPRFIGPGCMTIASGFARARRRALSRKVGWPPGTGGAGGEIGHGHGHAHDSGRTRSGRGTGTRTIRNQIGQGHGHGHGHDSGRTGTINGSRPNRRDPRRMNPGPAPRCSVRLRTPYPMPSPPSRARARARALARFLGADRTVAIHDA
jgi:hypothetical protein